MSESFQDEELLDILLDALKDNKTISEISRAGAKLLKKHNPEIFLEACLITANKATLERVQKRINQVFE